MVACLVLCFFALLVARETYCRARRHQKNEQEEKDYVLDVDSHKGIHSTKPKEILKELVIPCEGNKYKFDKYNVKSINKKGSKVNHIFSEE